MWTSTKSMRSGIHRSPHRGASVIFAEHRDYRPGDDLRLLDWRAFARSDRYTIKHFEQETHLRAHLLLDISTSMAFDDGDPAPQQPGPWTLHRLALTVTWPQGRRIELQTLRMLRTR